MAPRAPAPGSPSSAARPAAERPRLPVTATASPGRAIERSRGVPVCSPRSVTLIIQPPREADVSAADDGDAMRSRGVPHARVEGVHVLCLGRGGEREGDQRPSRTAAHRGDVGEIDGHGLPADVVEGGRRSAEVHVLHDEVGRREQDGITRHVQHGGIVADPGPDACSERAAGLAQPADQSELAELLRPYASGTCLDGTSSAEADERSSDGLGGSESPIMRCGVAPCPPGAGRSLGQTFASIFFLIWAFGTAPMTWSTTSPLLMKRMVGMERMP